MFCNSAFHTRPDFLIEFDSSINLTKVDLFELMFEKRFVKKFTKIAL